MITAPESLQSVFDRTFAGIGQVREAFTPQLAPREVGTIISVATGIAKVSGLPSVGFEELVKFPGDVLGIAFNVDEDEIGVVLSGNTGICTPAIRSSARAGSWMWSSATSCWDASSARSVGRSMERGRWLRASACRSNAPPPPSWTARPSPCHSRPD